MIHTMENDYATRELPKEVQQAEKMLRDHLGGRELMHNVIKDRINEGEEIVIRVRQQVKFDSNKLQFLVRIRY